MRFLGASELGGYRLIYRVRNVQFTTADIWWPRRSVFDCERLGAGPLPVVYGFQNSAMLLVRGYDHPKQRRQLLA